MRIDDFDVRERANEGVKVPLQNPDGTESGEWLLIRSVYSDEYRKTKLRWDRRISTAKIQGEDDQIDALHSEMFRDHAASLVAGWSLEDEYTTENVQRFLVAAPQLVDRIIMMGDQHALFFSKPQQNS